MHHHGVDDYRCRLTAQLSRHGHLCSRRESQKTDGSQYGRSIDLCRAVMSAWIEETEERCQQYTRRLKDIGREQPPAVGF